MQRLEVSGQRVKADMNFDIEWKWNDVELETGEVYVGQKYYGEGID